ncbi:MAG: hemerythrin domain-containing protein [Acidobacteriota bacterium]
MNAIELLTADHRIVDKLFQQVEATNETDHPAIFEQIKANLDAHAHIEETIFYPSLQEAGDETMQELVSEAIQEHLQMKTVLGELAVLVTDPAKLDPLLLTLIEDVRHHVEEEESELFPMVEEQLDAASLDELGQQMEAEKKRFIESAESMSAQFRNETI